MAASSMSPRLPSPPPMAEDQLGPKSPIAALSEEQRPFAASLNGSQASARRIRPGTRAEDMAEGPPLVDIGDIDSAFQLTEHLKALYAYHTTSSSGAGTIALTRSTALLLAAPPSTTTGSPSIDRSLWLYELCRFLTQKANLILISLFNDSPPCSATTCPEMRASEWQYLCAVHDPPKSCCAVDYCCHTLDWAANVLTSPRHFPSRLSLSLGSSTGGGTSGGDSGKAASASTFAEHHNGEAQSAGGSLGSKGGADQHQVRQLTNIMRRVYRIFAHAWFQHREVFWRVEQRTGLYVFFKNVCDVYQLIPEDNYTVPPEAEGIDDITPVDTQRPREPHEIMKRRSDDVTASARNSDIELEATAAGTPTAAPSSSNTRHRQTSSMTSSSFTTVLEESEDDEQSEDESQISVIEYTCPESAETPSTERRDAQTDYRQRGEDTEGIETAEVDESSRHVEVRLSEVVTGEDMSTPAQEGEKIYEVQLLPADEADSMSLDAKHGLSNQEQMIMLDTRDEEVNKQVEGTGATVADPVDPQETMSSTAD